MRKANLEVRTAMKEKGVPAWAIGTALQVHENTVLRRLRTELSAEDKQNYINIIDELSKTNETTKN